MSKSLNIGLIGSGFMGQAHADAYRRAGILYRNLPRTPELYAIADQNDALAEQAPGEARLCKSLRRLAPVNRRPRGRCCRHHHTKSFACGTGFGGPRGGETRLL